MNDYPDIIIGSLAPEFSLPASNGTDIALADFRSKNIIYLFFVREFNWMQCRNHSAQLGRLYKEFQAANCEILLILEDSLEKARRYVDSLHLPFSVLADPERNVYHQYGLEKAMIFIQRTASVVIDHKGVIRYLRSTTNPMVWLHESQELLDFVKSITSAGWFP